LAVGMFARLSGRHLLFVSFGKEQLLGQAWNLAFSVWQTGYACIVVRLPELLREWI
jgi:hypothetical protein